MSDENETKLVPFKFPLWFRNGLAKAKEKTDKKPARNVSEIVISAVCKVEKIKKPKGFKFKKAYRKD